MDIRAFLDEEDAIRAERTLQRLARHDVSGWALTGGLAIEIQIMARGGDPIRRPLNDIDFIAASFASIPASVAEELYLRHVHPHDPPGKTLLQGVHRDTAVRVDVFRAYGLQMERTVETAIAGARLRMASFHDLVARHARLNWDLAEGKPLAPKYARDFLRMAALVSAGEIQSVWQEHRKAACPDDFAEALSRLRAAIRSRPELLIAPAFSTNPRLVCGRCQPANGFPLAEPERILSMLGYC